MLGIEDWNRMQKISQEVEAVAVQGDSVCEIGGILFLVQRTNGVNNIVCMRISPSAVPLRKVLEEFTEWMRGIGIEYARIEGNSRRYRFLLKLAPELGCGIYQDMALTQRNVFYVKLKKEEMMKVVGWLQQGDRITERVFDSVEEASRETRISEKRIIDCIESGKRWRMWTFDVCEDWK